MSEKQVNSGQVSVKQKSVKTNGKETGKKKVYIAIVVILLVSTAVAMAVLIVTKNSFGGRDVILDFLTSMDPAYETVQEQQLILEAVEQELSSREEKVVKKEAALAEQEAELEEKAAALEQEEVLSSFNLYISSLPEERIAQFVQLGTIYSNMEPEQAVEAISGIGSVLDMAVVIYYMKPENSAEVFNYMDSELAAQITESLLK